MRGARVALAALVALAIVGAGAWVGERARVRVADARTHPIAATGAIETPSAEGIPAGEVEISGWAAHARGIERVELRVAGHVLRARHGEPRDGVAPSHFDANVGFRWRGTMPSLSPGRHPLEVWAVSRAGEATLLGRRSVVVLPTSSTAERSAIDRPFYFLLAYSGTSYGGAKEADTEYAAYQSATFRTGVTVPILYMRTTRGRAGDWVFDPDFDARTKCGVRNLADDSLNEVIAQSIAKRLPTMFVLNGGIWADSGCDVPDHDLNDHLERTPLNCQWTQDDAVFADDHLKNLSGSIDSPELARSLTYNVYASEVRRYKRRNLMAAAQRIAAFARAHPDLFVGVTLDADTYMNPFFDGQQWFDYNPGTLRQFRDWLRTSGPYAGDTREGVPDLSAHRRDKPLTLAEVNRLAKRNWRSWDEVDAPRRFPGSPRDALGPSDTAYWDDPWFGQWDVFRKHVIALHYEDLATWTSEAGIDASRIFSAQGFSAPYGRNRPFALRVASTGQNYDSAGMSLEGAKPAHGHLGAILYGRAAENDVPTENGRSLFWNFANVDRGWGIVELSIAALNRPEHVPTYDRAYRAFRDAFNFDARLITVMAWNGMRGSEAGKPGYRAYTSWRETAPEEAMRDFAVSHANVPPGSRLWTFGSPRLASDDGWTVEGGKAIARNESLAVQGAAQRVVLVSPRDQWIRPDVHRRLRMHLSDGSKAVREVAVSVRLAKGGDWVRVASADRAAPEGAFDLSLAWPNDSGPASQVRVEITGAAAIGDLAVRRVALLR